MPPLPSLLARHWLEGCKTWSPPAADVKLRPAGPIGAAPESQSILPCQTLALKVLGLFLSLVTVTCQPSRYLCRMPTRTKLQNLPKINNKFFRLSVVANILEWIDGVSKLCVQKEEPNHSSRAIQYNGCIIDGWLNDLCGCIAFTTAIKMCARGVG